MAIDAATRESLELTCTAGGTRKGSLLDAVDRTVTGAGARLLAADIGAPLMDRAAIEAAERRQGSVPSPASLPPQAVPRQGTPQPGVPPQGVPQQGVPQQGVSQRGAHEQGARPQRPTPIRQPIERPGRRRRESE